MVFFDEIWSRIGLGGGRKKREICEGLLGGALVLSGEKNEERWRVDGKGYFAKRTKIKVSVRLKYSE